jgi:hypothetical protein
MNIAASEVSVEIPATMVVNGFIQNMLQGIIFCQVVHYWTAYTDDSKWKRFYVASFVFVSMYGILNIYQSSLYLRNTVFKLFYKITKSGGCQYSTKNG